MKKPAFLSNERLSRLMTALLLALGLLWPMLWALGVESAFVTATLATAALTALMTFQAAGKKARVICFSLLGALLIGQFFLPGGGFFPSSVEAVKAISLYFNGVTTAPLLFSSQIALLLAVAAAVIGYAFSARGVGYIPATAMVVMVLFGLWSMGKQGFLWYAAPALVALLLLIAQSSHEKSNLFQVLPMAAMLVALGLLIAPGQNVVLGPLHEVAMNLKQTITDYLFFTEPRNVFTLGSYGYYPMGSGKLGGEAEPTEYPVMTVKTSQKTLLRAVTKDEYTGRSWRDTSSGRRYLYVNPRWRSLRQEVFLENMPAETVLKASNLLDQKAISIQMQNSAASTVFTPVFSALPDHLRQHGALFQRGQRAVYHPGPDLGRPLHRLCPGDRGRRRFAGRARQRRAQERPLLRPDRRQVYRAARPSGRTGLSGYAQHDRRRGHAL